MKTRIVLTLCHRTTPERVVLHKTVDGAVLAPFRHQELNFIIEIGDSIETEIQSVTWVVEDALLVIRTSYVTYELIDEMHQEAESLRLRGWG